MSRFIEVLEDNCSEISYEKVLHLSDAMLARLEAETGYIKVTFPFFGKACSCLKSPRKLWTMKLPRSSLQKNSQSIVQSR